MSLSDVEKYILANKKLPDIPSSAEVKADGVNLGEMNALMLKKIEELTIYVIEQNKAIEELKHIVNLQNKKIAGFISDSK